MFGPIVTEHSAFPSDGVPDTWDPAPEIGCC